MVQLRRRMNAKNQIAIPVVLLKKYHFRAEEDVIFEAGKDGIVLRPAIDAITRGRGLLKGKLPPVQQIKDEIRREERMYEQRKFGI